MSDYALHQAPDNHIHIQSEVEWCHRSLVGILRWVLVCLKQQEIPISDTQTLSQLVSEACRQSVAAECASSNVHTPYKQFSAKLPATCRNKAKKTAGGGSFEGGQEPKNCCKKVHDGMMECFCENLAAYPNVWLDGGCGRPCTTLPCIFEVMTGACTSEKCEHRHYCKEAGEVWERRAIGAREAAAHLAFPLQD